MAFCMKTSISHMYDVYVYVYVCTGQPVYICIYYIYGEKNIVLVLVPRVDSDK